MTFAIVEGLASKTDTEYEHWDAYGPYMETVAAGAFLNLGESPGQVHLYSHSGVPFSSTRGGGLEIWENKEGLNFRSKVDLETQSGRELIRAVNRGDVVEASFAGHIVKWEWNSDFDELLILGIDMRAGDVTSCPFGANPYTWSRVERANPQLEVERRLRLDALHLEMKAVEYMLVG